MVHHMLFNRLIQRTKLVSGRDDRVHGPLLCPGVLHELRQNEHTKCHTLSYHYLMFALL